MNSAEISNQIDSKEKELAKALSNAQVVEQEKLLLQREILEKQTKKKDLEIALSKANHLVKQLTIEIRLKKNEFWSAKNSGA